MEAFTELINRLDLDENNCLMLDTVPMILMPRWFFVGIMKRVVSEAGLQLASKIYYAAGYEGAYNWSKVQIDKGLRGLDIIKQYLGSMTYRGWGRFDILSFDDAKGRGSYRLHNSALALELGQTGKASCLWVPGALAGSMQAVLESKGNPLKVRGREIRCLATGEPFCEYTVEPTNP
jgi:predicted hydrocarbon binding protein